MVLVLEQKALIGLVKMVLCLLTSLAVTVLEFIQGHCRLRRRTKRWCNTVRKCNILQMLTCYISFVLILGLYILIVYPQYYKLIIELIIVPPYY